jgi:N-acetylneuraminic acid mutarotase
LADATTLNGGQTALIVAGYNFSQNSSLTSVEASTVTGGGGGNPGPWVTKTPYPLSVYGAALASDGTFAYSFGGNTFGGSTHAEAYRYDISTNTWTAVMSMTTGADYFMHADYAPTTNKIYVQGGVVNETANRIYDVAANTWSSGAALPVPVYNQAQAYYNGKVYLIGGYVAGMVSPGVYAYDIASNSWSFRAFLPQAEAGMAAAAINGNIYVAGGTTNGNDFLTNLYIYNIAANSWSSGPPMSAGARFPGGTAVQGKLWVIGGGQPSNGSALPQAGMGAPGAPDTLSTTQIYDPVSNTWSVGPTLNTARAAADATTLNVSGGQTALIVAGFNSSSGSLTSVEASSVTSGSCATPSPTRTNSPTNTPTATPTPSLTPRLTPSPTPSACSIEYSDVPVGSTFYPYVRCLACRGIINGYPDGTFKPNNNVTRGQLSKIVSNSAGFHDAQPHQMFEDVPVGTTFQVYIGRLASRGYINGYPCGGAGEPCVPPANLPYFRPNANATRGQISKIVSNAAGFSDPPMRQQFEDVAVGSTYYTYTFRLVSRGVMSGYPCGGAGEPCIPPGNLPYFRPNNNATRGQTSKIVSNTFFPNCQTPARK